MSLDSTIDRLFGRWDAVVDAIDKGQDAQPLLTAMDKMAPYELLALGNAFMSDQLKREREADDELFQFLNLDPFAVPDASPQPGTG